MKRIALMPLFSLVLVTTALTACAYVIPPDPNMPRNNTVEGDIRKPQYNPVGGAYAMPKGDEARTDSLTPVGQTAAAGVRASASAPVAPTVTASVAPPPAPPQYRMVPVENDAMQLAGNFDNIPPKPIMQGEGSAKERLTQTQQELEADHAAAMARKEALEREVSAEPSMLSDLPKVEPSSTKPLEPLPATPPAAAPKVTPPTAPTSLAPLPPEKATPVAAVTPPPATAPMEMASAVPMSAPQPVAATSPAQIYVPVKGPAPTLPAGAQFAPPPPKPGTMPEPKPVSAASRAVSAPEPLMTKPPVPVASAPAAPSMVNGIKVEQGDFNPLAEDEPAANAAARGGATSSSPELYAPQRYYRR